VVGRLVEQQQVGLGDQRARQRHALDAAAGEGDGQTGLAPDFAVVERAEAGQRLEQAGLAAAVAADEADALAGIDLQRRRGPASATWP
jgi:hypothetical protein